MTQVRAEGRVSQEVETKLHSKLFILDPSLVLFGNDLVVPWGDIQAILLVNYVYSELLE